MQKTSKAPAARSGNKHPLEGIMHIVFWWPPAFRSLRSSSFAYSSLPTAYRRWWEIGILKFLTGTMWRPGNDIYGILPMILGSIYVTAGALIIGVPIGLLTAVFLARFCPKGAYRFIKPAVSLMAGIPSVVYGFFGMCILVPIIRPIAEKYDGSGFSMLTASILLGIMILPTIVEVTESSLRAVPESYYEASLALGATHERSVYAVLFPAAKSGIMAGVILGIGRAVRRDDGGHHDRRQPAPYPDSIFEGVRTMTAQHRHRDGLRFRPPPRGADLRPASSCSSSS